VCVCVNGGCEGVLWVCVGVDGNNNVLFLIVSPTRMVSLLDQEIMGQIQRLVVKRNSLLGWQVDGTGSGLCPKACLA
jgi:hypothetical protein